MSKGSISKKENPTPGKGVRNNEKEEEEFCFEKKARGPSELGYKIVFRFVFFFLQVVYIMRS
jgi:hypothetical protein